MHCHKIKEAKALPNLQLEIQFTNGTTKIYDLKRLFNIYPAFKDLENVELFLKVAIEPGGYGIYWNDLLDLDCDELWENGKQITTPFDNLMAFSEASDLWGLEGSTLRKAIATGKLVAGVDARKYGKQWIITKEAMLREYGQPKE